MSEISYAVWDREFPTERTAEAYQGFPILSEEGAFPPVLSNVGETMARLNLPALNRDRFWPYMDVLEKNGYTVLERSGEPIRNKTHGAVLRKGNWTYIARCSSSGFITAYPFKTDRTFTKEEVFADFPEYREDSLPAGDGHYRFSREYCEKVHIRILREKLEALGYCLTAENPDGVHGETFYYRYTKNRHTVILLYSTVSKILDIIFTMDEPLSPFLQKTAKEERKLKDRTSLTEVELFGFGNSFLVQLKNGHFIMNDGGFPEDLPYLMDYMESLLPEGEKPVVDAWFITHGHGDHVGIFMFMNTRPDLYDRILVNGVYYSWPRDLIMACDPHALETMHFMKKAVAHFRDENGRETTFYRPHTGERYYFPDMTVDIVETQEQILYENFSGDYNDSSTWYLYTIEGQTLLIGGDGDKGGFEFIKKSYTPSIGTVDMMTSLHHGHNSGLEIVNYFHMTTLLCSSRFYGPDYRREGNDIQIQNAKEAFPYALGGRVFYFPYQPGESVLLPHNPWKYNPGASRRLETVFTKMKNSAGEYRLKIWAYRWIRPVRALSVPVYVKEFTTEKEIFNADLVVTATGAYEVLLNGDKLGDYMLSPGRYEARYIQCKKYDVTHLLKADNRLEVTVGEGFVHADKEEIHHLPIEDKNIEKALLLQINITYTDGTTTSVGTDSSFKAYDGPVTDASVFTGEQWDFGKALSGETDCEPFDGPIVVSTSETENEPARVIEEKNPASAEKLSGGRVLYDFGAEKIGTVRLSLNGHGGERFSLLLAGEKERETILSGSDVRTAKKISGVLKDGLQEFTASLTYGSFRYAILEKEGNYPEKEHVFGLFFDKDPASRC